MFFKKKYLPAILILIFFFSNFSTGTELSSEKVHKDTAWSVLMSDAVIARNPKIITYDTTDVKWNYEQGLICYALWNVYKKTGNKKYYDYIKKNIDYFLTDDGKIKTYDYNKFRLDDIAPARIILYLYQKTKNDKYKKAALLFRKQLANQPRVKEGGFWHKEIYPNQMWLDGLYMAEPFYAKYAKIFNETEDYNDIAKQFLLIYDHTKDLKIGLLYHGWDSSKKQKWANPETGDSPSFWGRAIGWYMMALVDVLDYFPKDHPQRQKLISILQELSKTLLKYKDDKTNLWYQVIDKPNKAGNYLEASASAMFMYSFAKGANKGYLNQNYFLEAKKTFKGIINNLVKTDKDGYPSLYKTCSVSGLGGNPYRDGSFEYYVNEPTRKNDFKGVGPFILGALELEKSSNKKVVGLDYYFNDEWKKDDKGKSYQFHYIWEDQQNSGYSEAGNLFKNLNAKITEVKTDPSKNDLDKLSIYIIVDPDIPQENPNPNYIDEKSISNIVHWVKNGGVLMLLANDKGNSEFQHLNNLSEKFGIHFNGDSRNHVDGKNFDMGKFDQFPDHPIFKDVKKIYLKEISTLKLTEPAKVILSDSGYVIMASSEFGKGFVFAVGDPWFYNEYVDNRKLPEGFENFKAAKNLFEWLLEKAEPIE